MQFEEAFDLEIPDEDAEKIKTVKDAIEYIREERERRQVALSNPSRRVVITGLGLVCAWATPLPKSGGSSAAPVAWGPFRASIPLAFRSPLCEVKNFDPLNFVDKKEARKMGRFIHFAFAATQEAIAQQAWRSSEIADRVGVFIGSASAASSHRARARQPVARRPAQISPFFIPAAIVTWPPDS